MSLTRFERSTIPESLNNWMDQSRANEFLIVSFSAMCAARSSRR